MLTDAHEYFREMAVAGGDAVAVVDLDQIAIAGGLAAVMTVPVPAARAGSPMLPRKSIRGWSAGVPRKGSLR